MMDLIPTALISEIRDLIEQSRTRVERQVNSEMVLLYWQIGLGQKVLKIWLSC